MNLSKRALENKYVHKALRQIGAHKMEGYRNIKREFIDKSPKHRGALVLKGRHVPKFKQTLNSLEFDDNFVKSERTYEIGRIEKTYSIDADSEWLQEHGGIFGLPIQLAKTHLGLVEGGRDVTYQLVMSYTCEDGDYERVDAISSRSRKDFDQMEMDMKLKAGDWHDSYKDGHIKKWDLVTRYSPCVVGQGGKTIQQAHKKWFQFSAVTKNNCGVVSLLFGMEAHQDGKRFAEYYQSEKNPEGKTLLSRRAIDLKKKMKRKELILEDNYADEATLQVLAKQKKCDIIVYDNVYNEKWKLKGTCSDKRNRTAWRPPVELQLSVNHFSTLCRWKDWKYEGHTVQGVERHGLTQESEKVKIETQRLADKTENKIIYPHVNVEKERSRKLAAYDLEASPDDNMRGCVRGGGRCMIGGGLAGHSSVPRS